MLIELFRLGVNAQSLPPNHPISFEKSVDTYMGRNVSMRVKLWDLGERPDILASVWIIISDRVASAYVTVGKTQITIKDEAMFKSAWRKDLDEVHDLYHDNQFKSKKDEVEAAVSGLQTLLVKFIEATGHKIID